MFSSALLINPPPRRIRFNISGVYPAQPLGIAHLASYLINKGFKVDIHDAAVDPLGLLKILKSNQKYDFYGLSATLFSLKSAISIARVIRENFPDAVIALGGPANLLGGELLLQKIPQLDVIVHGEGEITLTELLANLKNRDKWANIDGITARIDKLPDDDAKKGAIRNIISTKPRKFMPTSDISPPAFRLLPMKRYRLHPPFGIAPPITTLETIRGCNYTCNFCALPHPVREKPLDNVLNEISLALNEYGIREIYFVDPTFTDNKKRTLDFCQALIREKLKFKWTCKTRPDCVSLELLEAMREAGCYMISYGIESCSADILEAIEKGSQPEHNENAIKWSKKAGIRSLCYVLIGSPGETDETVRETIKQMRLLNPDFVLYGILAPAPASPLVDRMISQGKFTREDLFYLYTDTELSPFQRENFLGFTYEKLNYWLRKANIDFYARPEYIGIRLLYLKNAGEITNLFKGLFYLLKDTFLPKNIIFD